MERHRNAHAATVEQARGRYLAAALLGDRPEAAAVTANLLARGVEPQAIIADVLVPTQVEMGNRWEHHECSVGQEHTVTGITEAVLSSITVGLEPPPTRGHVVLACAEGEYHTLPARLYAEHLILDGWRVTFLGAAVPADHLHRYLAGVDAEVVGVSCTVAANLTGAARSVIAARQAGHTVVVGGAGFGADDRRARRLGAHGWVPPDATLGPLELDAILWSDPGPTHRTGEWQLLDRDRRFLVAEALDWLDRRHPALMPSASSPLDEAIDATRADLELTLRYVAGALVADDPRVLTDHATWLRAVLTAQGYPEAVAGLEFEALAAATDGQAPRSSALLRATLDS